MSSGLSENEQARLQQLARELRTAGPVAQAPAGEGRGIVICAGGARLFTNAYVLIRVLRDTLGCRLPIELWHFGRGEVSPAMAAVLRGLGVELVDATPLIEASGVRVRDGWQLKSFALLWSGFRDILMLDADQVPVTDPAALFDWPEYRATGAVFWPDVIELRRDNPVWRALGLEPAQRRSFESGQLLVDKARHAVALSTALRLNEAADLLYQLIYGDKDCFLVAWLMHGAPFALVPHLPFLEQYFLAQRDFSGAVLFQHRTNCKWVYAGEQLHPPGFRLEPECLGYLDDLRGLWGGRVFKAPDRSLAARTVEAELVAAGAFVLLPELDARQPLVFRPEGEFGTGRSFDRRNWWVEEDAEGVVLVFFDGESRTHAFRPAAEGYWIGRRFRLPEVAVVLRSAADIERLAAGRGAVTRGLVAQVLDAAGLDRLDKVPAGLAEALVLLSRVLPEVPETLRRMAAESGNVDHAGRLEQLAERVEAATVAPSRAASGALESGYTSVGEMRWF